MVSQLDLYPTICDVAGVEHPDFLQGTSMMPLVTGESASIHDQVFSEVTYHAAYEPQRAVRTDRWKYIRRFDGRDRAVLANCDDSATKDLLVEAGWGDRPVAEEELYDLLLDPSEEHNLAAEARCAGKLDEMRGRLSQWMENTADPLLDGPIPPPPGAEINDPDQISPDEPLISIPA